MSITTKRGDGGVTSLVCGIRVSKGDLRVEAYGTIDELNAALRFARSICTNAEISSWTRDIQKTLFHIGSALATAPESQKGAAPLTAEDVDSLTDLVHSIGGKEGILSDWSLPGAHTGAAAFDVARTICRRAERCIVRLIEDEDAGRAPHPQVLPYINRLSDLISLLEGCWNFARKHWVQLASVIFSRILVRH